jgi:ubiquitin carboxyl-terminal hydrolase 25/28
VIAYLSRPCDVYSLLDGAYDESVIEAGNGISQYREISSLPPIMHLSVERGQVDRMKCEEPLKLPELIYMDRYMSTPEILEKRRQAWIGRAQLRILQDKRDTLTKTATGLDIPQTMTSTQDYLQQIAGNAAALGVDADLIDTPLLEALGSSAAAAHRQIEALNSDISQHEQKVDNLFAEDRKLPYRLHAVFMHRSGQGRVDGGHWFIYIYDKRSAQWRRYNDETITKVMDPKPFLDPIQGRAREEGTSSFVVYVREDMADELVETVHRVPRE